MSSPPSWSCSYLGLVSSGTCAKHTHPVFLLPLPGLRRDAGMNAGQLRASLTIMMTFSLYYRLCYLPPTWDFLGSSLSPFGHHHTYIYNHCHCICSPLCYQTQTLIIHSLYTRTFFRPVSLHIIPSSAHFKCYNSFCISSTFAPLDGPAQGRYVPPPGTSHMFLNSPDSSRFRSLLQHAGSRET